jgi:hypothetical protein
MVLYPEDVGTIFFRNIGIRLPIRVVSPLRRPISTGYYFRQMFLKLVPRLILMYCRSVCVFGLRPTTIVSRPVAAAAVPTQPRVLIRFSTAQNTDAASPPSQIAQLTNRNMYDGSPPPPPPPHTRHGTNCAHVFSVKVITWPGTVTNDSRSR